MRAGSRTTSSSACTAWARRSTRRCSPSCRRRRAASTRRSAATGICSPIWCAACSRTAPTPPSCRRRPTPMCRSPPSCGARKPPSGMRATPATRAFRCRAISMGRSAATPPASNSATAAALAALLAEIEQATGAAAAAPLIDGIEIAGRTPRAVISPIDGTTVGQVTEGDAAIAAAAMTAAQRGFADWEAVPVERRAAALARAGDLLEARRGWLIALMGREGGKTIDDGIAEVREAVDFCRYYAAQARRALAPAADAGADRRKRSAALSRARRVRVHQPVEFPALDLSRPGERRAARRQRGGRQAGRADPAHRRRGGAHPARSRRAGKRAPPGAGRRRGRRRPGGGCAHRRRRLHRLDRGGAEHQSRARRLPLRPPKGGGSCRSSPRPAASIR